MVQDLGFTVTYRVIESWDALKRIPNYEEIAGSLLYENLFEEFPQAKPLFGYPTDDWGDNKKYRSSAKFRIQGKHIIEMLDKPISFLGPDIEFVTEELQALGQRHDKYGVTSDMYPFMGKALIKTLANLLGKQFTSEVKDAWEAIFNAIVHDMVHNSPQN